MCYSDTDTAELKQNYAVLPPLGWINILGIIELIGKWTYRDTCVIDLGGDG